MSGLGAAPAANGRAAGRRNSRRRWCPGARRGRRRRTRGRGSRTLKSRARRPPAAAGERPHEHVASALRRAAFEPVDVVAVHGNLPEAQGAGRGARGGEGRGPRAVGRLHGGRARSVRSAADASTSRCQSPPRAGPAPRSHPSARTGSPAYSRRPACRAPGTRADPHSRAASGAAPAARIRFRDAHRVAAPAGSDLRARSAQVGGASARRERLYERLAHRGQIDLGRARLGLRRRPRGPSARHPARVRCIGGKDRRHVVTAARRCRTDEPPQAAHGGCVAKIGVVVPVYQGEATLDELHRRIVAPCRPSPATGSSCSSTTAAAIVRGRCSSATPPPTRASAR